MSVDLREATERVNLLGLTPFQSISADVSGPTFSVLFDPNVDYNCSDRGAFDTRFTDETHGIAQLVRIRFFFLCLFIFDWFKL